MKTLAQDVTAAIGILAGLLLCLAVIVTAIRRFRRDSDVGDLLAALLAAVVALASGTLTPIIIAFTVPALSGQLVVTAGNLTFACLSILVSAPLGMGWGWASSFVWRPAAAVPWKSRRKFVVRGMLLGLLAASTSIPACSLAILARHGHDGTITFPGLLAGLSFFGATILVTALIFARCWNQTTGEALRQIGTGLGAAIFVAFGVLAGAIGVASLLQDAASRFNAWSILILFYPFYILALFAIALALTFLAARTLAHLWSRLPTS